VLVLAVISGPDAGKRFELPANEPQLLGRSSEALPLGDHTVSRRHAELTPDRGVWYIRDLRSQNGTYVNNVRIADRTRLNAGDQIRVGATVLMFGGVAGESETIRLLGPEAIDETIERTLPVEAQVPVDRNQDSLVMADPEPRAAEHLRLIYRLTTITTQALPRRELLSKVLDLVMSEFRCERGVVLLGPGGDSEYRVAAMRRRGLEVREAEGTDLVEGRGDGRGDGLAVSRTIVDHAVRTGHGVLSSNAMSDPRFNAGDSVQRMRIRSAICAPIRHQGRTFGALYIDSSIANYTFTAEQLALMNAVGQQTALALANAELVSQRLQTQRLAAIGETVASLSHAIKNILQGLRGGADVVEMGLKKDDLKVAKGGWGILSRNLDRIVSLTMNMLAFSRQRSIEPEITPLNVLVEECAKLVETQCSGRGIVLMVDADPELPPISCDAALIHQAVMNLLTNAIDAVANNTGKITVRTTYRPAALVGGQAVAASASIAVIDNGAGISKERLSRLFEPFQTTKGTRGTGLGLAVTKRIVEEHGGRIAVESEGVAGGGATFRLTLPADASKAIDPSQTAQPKEKGR
jgi:two-component system, NtrC family, sensor kinase